MNHLTKMTLTKKVTESGKFDFFVSANPPSDKVNAKTTVDNCIGSLKARQRVLARISG